MVKVVSPIKKTKNEDKKVDGTIYVYPRFGCEFLIISDVKEGKYSRYAEIEPIYGEFYDAKAKKVYHSNELVGKRVIINLPKDDGITYEKSQRVLWGEVDNFIVVQVEKEDENDG